MQWMLYLTSGRSREVFETTFRRAPCLFGHGKLSCSLGGGRSGQLHASRTSTTVKGLHRISLGYVFHRRRFQSFSPLFSVYALPVGFRTEIPWNSLLGLGAQCLA